MTLDQISVLLDVAILFTVVRWLVPWRMRKRVAQKILDQPQTNALKSEYKVMAKKPDRIFYNGPDLKQAKVVRNMQRRLGIDARLFVNGEARN